MAELVVWLLVFNINTVFWPLRAIEILKVTYLIGNFPIITNIYVISNVYGPNGDQPTSTYSSIIC